MNRRAALRLMLAALTLGTTWPPKIRRDPPAPRPMRGPRRGQTLATAPGRRCDATA